MFRLFHIITIFRSISLTISRAIKILKWQIMFVSNIRRWTCQYNSLDWDRDLRWNRESDKSVLSRRSEMHAMPRDKCVYNYNLLAIKKNHVVCSYVTLAFGANEYAEWYNFMLRAEHEHCLDSHEINLDCILYNIIIIQSV